MGGDALIFNGVVSYVLCDWSRRVFFSLYSVKKHHLDSDMAKKPCGNVLR